MELLKQTQRDIILNSLSEEQRSFLADFLKRGKRTAFTNVMAEEKASSAYQWEFDDFIDAGPGWQKNPMLYCECGRALRYQYIVKNSVTGEVKKFGIKHFEDHVGIPPHLAMEIKKGLEKIDYELDEVLQKVRVGWTIESEGIESIPKEVETPKDIQEHLNLQLPLLNRQVSRLRERIREYNDEIRRKRLKEKQELQEERLKNSNRTVHDQQVRGSYARGSRTLRNHHQSSSGLDVNLTSLHKQGIIDYLKQSKASPLSARGICEFLIDKYGASAATYSGGTYQIFGDVCVFLKGFVEQGALEYVEKNSYDCLYRMVEQDKIKNVGSDDDRSQLSLF